MIYIAGQSTDFALAFYTLKVSHNFTIHTQMQFYLNAQGKYDLQCAGFYENHKS